LGPPNGLASVRRRMLAAPSPALTHAAAPRAQCGMPYLYMHLELCWSRVAGAERAFRAWPGVLLAPLLAMADAAPLGVDEAAAAAAAADVRAASPEALAAPDEAAVPARCRRAGHPNPALLLYSNLWSHAELAALRRA